MDPKQIITFVTDDCIKANRQKMRDILCPSKDAGMPVKIISVCGPFKSGKSTLLNTWCDSPGLFKVGHTTDAETAGVCMHVIDRQQDRVVLLDVEGWDNSKSKNRDIWLPLIIMMISSEVVINIKNNIDNTCLRNTSYPLDMYVIYSISSLKLVLNNKGAL